MQKITPNKKGILITSIIAFIIYSASLASCGVSTEKYDGMVKQVDSLNKAMAYKNSVIYAKMAEVDSVSSLLASLEHPVPNVETFTQNDVQIHDWDGDNLSITAKWVNGRVYWTVTSSTMRVHDANRLYLENNGIRLMLCNNPKWTGIYDSDFHQCTNKNASGVTENVSLELWNSVVKEYGTDFGYYAISRK
jgi:hypothetical protein